MRELGGLTSTAPVVLSPREHEHFRVCRGCGGETGDRPEAVPEAHAGGGLVAGGAGGPG